MGGGFSFGDFCPVLIYRIKSLLLLEWNMLPFDSCTGGNNPTDHFRGVRYLYLDSKDFLGNPVTVQSLDSLIRNKDSTKCPVRVF